MNTITFHGKPRIRWHAGNEQWACWINWSFFFVEHTSVGAGSTPAKAYAYMVRQLGYGTMGEAVETQFRLQFGYYDNLRPTSTPANQAGMEGRTRC